MRPLLFILATLALLGCQSPVVDYSILASEIAEGSDVAIVDLRQSFLASDDLSDQLKRLTELEAQALALLDDEPLKLGSIGSAILDIYYGSLTGHYVMQQFYEHVESAEAAEQHAQWQQNITEFISNSGDGTGDTPLLVITTTDPQVYERVNKRVAVGSIYRTSDEPPFSMLLQSKPETGPLRSTYFDLQALYDAVASASALDPSKTDSEINGSSSKADEKDEFSSFNLISVLAEQNDSAAQTAIGAYLATHNRQQDAVNWLKAASRSGNLVANLFLARLYWEQAAAQTEKSVQDEKLDLVLDNYLHAIALGSSEAMYSLGVLYLNGQYGEDNVTSGMPLLQQATELDHAGAALYLGQMHYSGQLVEKSTERAADYFVQAAELGSPSAAHIYARFVLDRSNGLDTPHANTHQWLADLAAKDDSEAMVLLGNLHARGLGVTNDNRQAVSWYQKAVDSANNDSAIVNEVAWTLTVSTIQGLQRTKYAKKIMDAMMTDDQEARQKPEFIDTWAATHAAAGDLSGAIELQQEALELATQISTGDDYSKNMLEELEKHLVIFQAGNAVLEPAP